MKDLKENSEETTTMYFFFRLDMDEILEKVEEQWMVKTSQETTPQSQEDICDR